jgi:putative chitinase
MNHSSLSSVIPSAVLLELPSVIEKFNISTPLRLAHFLAQCGHESGGFKAFTENLNYSAQGSTLYLWQILPNRGIG